MSASHHDDPAGTNRSEDLSRLEHALRGHADAVLPRDDNEIAAYVDGTMDDVAREIFETHLEDDPALQTEVRELRALRSALTTPGSRPGPAWKYRSWLGAAAVLALATGGSALWLFATRAPEVRLVDVGGPVVMRRSGSIEGLDSLPVELRVLVGDSLRSGRVALPPLLDRLRVREQGLMGGSTRAPFELTAPVGTVARTDRPTFRWRPLAGASSYRVSIYDEHLGPIAASPDLQAAEWTSTAPLPRGVLLLWQVEASTPEGRVLAPAPSDPQARFEVMPASGQRALEARLNAAGVAHLARAVVLAEAGLIDEARAELEALKVHNPEAPVLDRLLDSTDRIGSAP